MFLCPTCLDATWTTSAAVFRLTCVSAERWSSLLTLLIPLMDFVLVQYNFNSFVVLLFNITFQSFTHVLWLLSLMLYIYMLF